MKFERYPISETIRKNLDGLGFIRTTDIQYKAIPSILRGEDVFATAQTGTGKTAAFAIPVIQKIITGKSKNRYRSGIKCIVLVPTHELALQIAEVFTSLARQTKVKATAIYGGVEQDPQIRKLQAGIDVLIATPGRMFDLIHQGYLDLKEVDTFVLDEADLMLDLGFIEDIKSVKKKLRRAHQTLFFSATINKAIKNLAYSQVGNAAIRIQISPEDIVSKNVTHYVLFVEMDDKRFFLQRFITDHPESKIIVFVRTRVRAERVLKAMARVEIESLAIHGDKTQEERAEIMRQFKAGMCNILIATDITARGIDIPDVNYIVNYDLPEQAENYVHRVGRTGRGMKKGEAISFCSKEENPRLEEIQGFLEKTIEVIPLRKKDYAFTLEHPKAESTLAEVVSEMRDWEAQKKKKKKRKS